MSTTVEDPTAPHVFFILWALLGAGACLAVLGALTIGPFVAPVVALLGWLLLRRSGADRSMAGALSGVSLMLFFVAWNNRGGPGEVCTVRPSFTRCSEQWNPWPWFVVGLAFLFAGVAVFYLLGRSRAATEQGV